MDDEFLQRATDAVLRLEAEGMTATAHAIRKVLDEYVLDNVNMLNCQASTDRAESGQARKPFPSFWVPKALID